MASTITKIVGNPDEAYEGTRTSGDKATVTVYVKEMTLNGNKVIAFALVVNGELKTAFVPAGQAPPGSNYNDAYSRENAINYIIEEVLKTATGQDTIEKIKEFEEVIEEIDVGEEV